jgi:hypothetical protein
MGKMKKEFEAKYLQLKKLIDSNQLIGNFLISNYDISFFDFLKSKARPKIKATLESKGYYDENGDILVLLTIVALTKYNGTFWSHVTNELQDLSDIFGEKRVEDRLRDYLEKSFKTVDNKRRIQAPLMNALVPQFYFDDFLDFLFHIFEENFNYSIPEDLNEQVTNIVKSLGKYLTKRTQTETESVLINSRSYKLIKSTADIFTKQPFSIEMQAFIEHLFAMINNFYNYESTTFENEYYKLGFDKLKTKLLNTARNTAGKNFNSKPYYELDNNILKVKLDSYLYYTDVTEPYFEILIVDGDKVYKLENEIDYKIKQVNLAYKIYHLKYQVKNSIKDVILTIKFSGENIKSFDLKRDFLIFDGVSEIKNHSDNYSKIKILLPTEIKTNERKVYEDHFYYIVLIDASKKAFLNAGIHKLTFRKTSNGIRGSLKDVKASLNQKSIDVYSEVDGVFFKSPTKEDFMVYINGKLIDFKKHVNSYEIDGQYVYEINYKLNSGINDTKVLDKKNKQYFNEKFIIDNLSYEETRNEELSYEMTLKSIFGTGKFKNQGNYYLISFEGNKALSYEIKSKFYLYSLDNINWKEINENYLWGPDLKTDSVIYLSGNNIDRIEVKDQDAELLFTSSDNSKLDFLTLSQFSSKKININIISNDKIVQTLLVLFSNLMFKDPIIIKDSEINKVTFEFNFRGKDATELIIRTKNKEVSRNPIKSNLALTLALEPGVNYIFELWCKKDQFLNKTYNLYQDNFNYLNFDYLINKTLEINGLVIDDDEVDKYIFKEVTATYILIDKKHRKGTYTGKLMYKARDRINNFIFNPIEIEVATELDNEFKVYLTKDEDGLLVESLSFLRYRIFNGLESKNKYSGYIYKVRIIK